MTLIGIRVLIGLYEQKGNWEASGRVVPCACRSPLYILYEEEDMSLFLLLTTNRWLSRLCRMILSEQTIGSFQ